MTRNGPITIAFLLFEGFTALDVVGPYDVLSRVPGAAVRLVAADAAPATDGVGALTLASPATLDENRSPSVVVVPGGEGVLDACGDTRILRWLCEVHETSLFTTSVCTGALLLGAASLLRGRRATTHWLSLPDLASYGAQPIAKRVVTDGKIITAAGVSAGIDMALQLASVLADERTAQAIQLSLEYAPAPPFDAGSPDTAPADVTTLVRRAAAHHRTIAPSQR
jgi:transcriptional regulator GlxA family with amidase domain